jgi:transcriptional regulator with XRE-family HTH domain
MQGKEEILRRFGRRLTLLRKSKQISIRELAALANIEYSQLLQIEAGKVNILYTTLLSLALALEVAPEELLQSL